MPLVNRLNQELVPKLERVLSGSSSEAMAASEIYRVGNKCIAAASLVFCCSSKAKRAMVTYPPEYMQQCSPYPQSRLEFTWSIPTQRTMHSLRRAMAETMYVRPRSDRKYADSADIKVPHTKKGKTAWQQQLLSEWKTLAATTTQRGENLGRNNYSARGKPWHPLARALTRS